MRIATLTSSSSGRVSTTKLRRAYAPGGPAGQQDGPQRPRRAIFTAVYVSRLALNELGRRQYVSRRVGIPTVASLLASSPVQLSASLPRDDAALSTEYDKASALEIARGAACGVHALLHYHFDRGLRARPLHITDALIETLSEEHSSYRHLLGRSRGATRQGSVVSLRQIYRDLNDRVLDEMVSLSYRAGRASKSSQETAAKVGLETSHLARHYAMLAAGLVMLEWRLLRSRFRARTMTTAAERSRLARNLVPLRGTRRSLAGASPGTNLKVIGRVDSLVWEEQPDKPRSIATLDGGLDLVVPYRNMARHGVVRGAHVWARGKVETNSEGNRFLKVEFEGPRQHAGTYWEDWLASLAKPAYDLYPGLLFMGWEFPVARRRGASTDFFARTRRPIREPRGGN